MAYNTEHPYGPRQQQNYGSPAQYGSSDGYQGDQRLRPYEEQGPYESNYRDDYRPGPRRGPPPRQQRYDEYSGQQDYLNTDSQYSTGPQQHPHGHDRGQMMPRHDRAYDQRYQQRPRDPGHDQGPRRQQYHPDGRPLTRPNNYYGEHGRPRDGYGDGPRNRPPRNDHPGSDRRHYDDRRPRTGPNGSYGPRPNPRYDGDRPPMDDWKARERARMQVSRTPDRNVQDNAFPSFSDSRPSSARPRHESNRSPPAVNANRPQQQEFDGRNGQREAASYDEPHNSGRSQGSAGSDATPSSRNRGYSDFHKPRPPPNDSYGMSRHDEYDMPSGRGSQPPRPLQYDQYPSPQGHRETLQHGPVSHTPDYASSHAREYAAEIVQDDYASLASPRETPSYNQTQDQRQYARPGPNGRVNSDNSQNSRTGQQSVQEGQTTAARPIMVHPGRVYSPLAAQTSTHASSQNQYTLPAPSFQSHDRTSLSDLYDDYHTDIGAAEPQAAQTRDEQIEREMPDFDRASSQQAVQQQGSNGPSFSEQGNATHVLPIRSYQTNGENGAGVGGATNFSVPSVKGSARSVNEAQSQFPQPSFADNAAARPSTDSARPAQSRPTPQGRFGPPNPQRFYETTSPSNGLRDAMHSPPQDGQVTQSITPVSQSGLNGPGPLDASRAPPVRNYDSPPSTMSERPPPVRNYDLQTTTEVSQPSPDSTDNADRPVTVAEIARLREIVTNNPHNPKQALTLVKKLSEASHVLANEGGHADGKTAARNREKFLDEALKRVKKLVSSGYPEAQFYLADCYGSGDLGLEVDSREAFGLYQAAAKQGHAQAAYRTAVCCEIGAEEGGGTRRDYAKAVQWYRRASALGDVAAMYKLGIILLRALLGQPRNVGEALNWLRRAADRADSDNPHAIHELATLHESTNRDPEVRNKLVADDNHARELYQQAAKMGFKSSQFRLGQAYEYGQLGLSIDNRSSIAWYSKAAAQGEHQAELALSGWYLTGAEGILEQSDTEAYLWARKAASSEVPQAKAMFAMGYFSEQGIGCPANPDEARRWYGRAASYKFPKALERLEELKRSSKGRLAPVNGKLSRKDQKKDESECVMM